MRRLAKGIGRSVLAIAALLGISLLFSAPRDAVWSLLFFADMAAGDRPSLYKRLTHPPTVSADTLVLADGLTVPFDLYHPRTETPAAALVLTHGLAHLGNRDPRVKALSRRLARAGFVVMAPDLLQMKTYKLGFRDVDALVASLNPLHGLPEVDPQKVGVIGPSYGAGPVLIAISRPSVRNRVRWAFLFGGYYDLRRALRYTLTGAYDAEGYTGRIGLEGNRHNRWKFLRGNVDLLPPSPSREEYIAFLSAKLDSPALDIRPALSRFSDAEQRTLIFIDNEDPARFDSLYATAPPSIHAWVDTLSMVHYTPGIAAHLLISHSIGDNKVHFTESLTLGRRLPNAPEPHVAVVGLFSHVDLTLKWHSLKALWQEVIPDLGRVWGLAYRLLRKRR